MSDGNGYDARGEDGAIRRSIGKLTEDLAKTKRSVSDEADFNRRTFDRLTLALGRVSNVEEMLTKLCIHLGVAL